MVPKLLDLLYDNNQEPPSWMVTMGQAAKYHRDMVSSFSYLFIWVVTFQLINGLWLKIMKSIDYNLPALMMDLFILLFYLLLLFFMLIFILLENEEQEAKIWSQRF